MRRFMTQYRVTCDTCSHWYESMISHTRAEESAVDAGWEVREVGTTWKHFCGDCLLATEESA